MSGDEGDPFLPWWVVAIAVVSAAIAVGYLLAVAFPA